MREEERNRAVAEHLRALDDEIERLRRHNEALDRRLEREERELDAIRRAFSAEEPAPPEAE
jgi:predicted  nucleic acid-binding Zn-ribbon protein